MPHVIDDHQAATDVTNDLEDVLGDEELSTLKKKSVSGAVSYMGRTLFLHVLSLFSAGVLAAYLTAADFGIYGVVTQVVGILTFISDIGFGSALIQKKQEPSLKEYRTIFTVQQLLAAVIFLITLGIWASNILEPKIGNAGEWVLLALGISFPLTTLKTISSVKLERRLEFGRLVLPQMVEQIVYNGLLIWLAMSGAGVMAYAYAILARTICGVVAMWLIEPWALGFHWDKAALKALLGVGSKFQLNDFLARIKDNLFYLFLGLWLPTDQFGYITLAKSFSQLPYQLTVQNVIAITFPTYARLQHQPLLLKRAIEKTLFFISFLIFPLLVGMCVFIYPFVELVPRYQKWQPALLTFVMFTLSIGWAAISTPLTNTLNAIGQINTTLKLMIMWTVLTWVLTPVMVWWFGFNGVAAAALVIAFTSILPIYYVQKVIPVAVWSSVWRQAVAALAMGIVGWLGKDIWAESWLQFIFGAVLTGGVYGSTLLILGRQVVWQELRSLRK